MAGGNPTRGGNDISIDLVKLLWLWLQERGVGPLRPLWMGFQERGDCSTAVFEGETRHLPKHCLEIRGICPHNRERSLVFPSRPPLDDEIIHHQDGSFIITGS